MRRVIFYLFFDPDGRVDDYVVHKLEALRAHAEHIFVVSNSKLEVEGKAKLEAVADTVWERENIGYDVWAYKEALMRFGRAKLADYDELILMNYTFFGPVGSFDPLFERMDAQPELGFWGVTDHGEVVPHPFTGAERMPKHIQSHWIAARKSLFTSKEFEAYWDDMPLITSYNDSIDRHEARFTDYFSSLGHSYDVAFSEKDYPSMHPIFDNATMVLQDGCPIVKRRTFFHDPLYLERNGILGRDIARIVEASGYPMELIWSNIARSAKPRVLATNFSLLEVLPEQDLGFDPANAPRVAAVAHIYYVEMTDELVDRFENLPTSFDLFVTTTDAAKKAAIVAILEARGVSADVRVVDSNNGRDISAFFIGCRDVIESDDYDLLVKLHSKKSPQDDHMLGELFKRHLFENLLSSPGYAANVLAMFQKHSSLGMVFPPVIHMGYPTLGHAWFLNKDRAQKEAKRIGITVPFDDSTPLSPFGSMFIARPEALRSITAAGYRYDDFPGDGDYRDGTLSHVLERLASYAVLSAGYHVRQVLNAEFAAIYYSFLEYKLQAISSKLPGYTDEQIAYLERTAVAQHEPPLVTLKRTVLGVSPAAGRVLRPAYRVGRKAFRTLRSVADRLPR